MDLFINYDLSSYVEKGIQVTNVGRNTLNQKITKEKYFTKMLIRYEVNQQKINIKKN